MTKLTRPKFTVAIVQSSLCPVRFEQAYRLGFGGQLGVA